MSDFSNAVNQTIHDRVFVLLFQREFRGDPVEILNEMTFSNEFSIVPVDAVVVNLTERILEHKKEIDVILNGFLENWTMERIMISDKEVLRMGIYELVFSRNQVPNIVIDRSLRIAKKYGDINSGKFVNGILGAVYRKHIKEIMVDGLEEKSIHQDA